MTDEDFEKLKKKVEENPLSKLTVSLAEEYIKRGLPDIAIKALIDAVKNQPNYISARAALGKIYHDKNMLSEARSEFEKVVGLSPLNLLAHKRLADIYYSQGDIDKALGEYGIVLDLNPEDEKARSALNAHKPIIKDTGETAAAGAHTPAEKDTRALIEKIPVYEIPEDVSGSDIGIQIPEKLIPVEEAPVSSELKEFRKIMESGNSDKPDKQGNPRHESKSDESRDKIKISIRTETMADIYIGQGLYDKAMEIYNQMLSSDPENNRIIRKCEELKMLMKANSKPC